MKRFYSAPFGAEPMATGAIRFRLWAPAAGKVDLCIEDGRTSAFLAMSARGDGWFELETDRAAVGSLYRYRIDGQMWVPDPASRFQPEDVHGPSEVIHPQAFEWRDEQWRGRPWEEAVIYEAHVGTFTAEGTFRALEARLDYLRELGITALELMPVADFPGRWNWGYDGVALFAPDSRYGRPADLKSLVQAAHARGMMVLLDVVYNHFGPEGNYLHCYAPDFFTERHHTPWGDAINFDGENAHWVRQFFIHNALYWLEEYHFDGLRLDAVHAINDDSRPDILEELAETVARTVGRRRTVHLVLENDRNAARYLRRKSDRRPCWYTAQWNDDFHHTLHVLTTGETRGYYRDYAEQPIHRLARCLREGFDFQGQRSPYRGDRPRGEPGTFLPPSAFVAFFQNHDQIGNRAFGERMNALVAPEVVQALTVLLLLSPFPPLLFMGQEWGAKQPFPFFCDFGEDLADRVREGRRREFANFPEFSEASARARIPDPMARATFESGVLDWKQAAGAEGKRWLDLCRRLLRIRQRKIVPRLAEIPQIQGEGRLLGERALQTRWRLGDESRLTLLANLGALSAPLEVWPAGQCLFAVPDETIPAFSRGVLPPWSVAWFLEEDDER